MTRYHAIKFVHVDYSVGSEVFHDCLDTAIESMTPGVSEEAKALLRMAVKVCGSVELEPLMTVPGRIAAVGLPHGVPVWAPVAVLQDLANQQWLTNTGPTVAELEGV